MSTTATIQATPAPAWRGDDFPHWLPPMLVRELRQGLSSGAFFWTFLLLQIALVLSLFFAVLGQSVNPALDGSRRIDGIFWTILILGLGLAMPLRGLSAVAAERTGNNLDLVRLTKLSATRIVVGKWLANVAQMLLVAVAVLPYMTVRYFFGGVNIVADLERLGWLLVVAAVVAALAVYYSTRPQRERIGMLVLLAFVGFGALGNLAMTVAGGGVMGFGGGWLLVAIAALYAALFLEAAAASIAPAAENHAFAKRLLALGCAATVAGVGLWGGRPTFWLVAVLLGLPVLFTAMGALCERPVRMRRMHAAFARGGLAGRLAAAVLTPGWATGIVFVGLAVGLTATGWAARAAADGKFDAIVPFLSLTCAAILFPLPLLLLLPRLAERTAFYVAVQMLCLIPWGVDLIFRELPQPVAGGGSGGLLAVVAPFPLAGILRLLRETQTDVRQTLFVAGCIVAAIILAVVARPWLREMGETQRLVGRRPAA
jgi:hypothetical protein